MIVEARFSGITTEVLPLGTHSLSTNFAIAGSYGEVGIETTDEDVLNVTSSLNMDIRLSRPGHYWQLRNSTDDLQVILSNFVDISVGDTLNILFFRSNSNFHESNSIITSIPGSGQSFYSVVPHGVIRPRERNDYNVRVRIIRGAAVLFERTLRYRIVTNETRVRLRSVFSGGLSSTVNDPWATVFQPITTHLPFLSPRSFTFQFEVRRETEFSEVVADVRFNNSSHRGTLNTSVSNTNIVSVTATGITNLPLGLNFVEAHHANPAPPLPQHPITGSFTINSPFGQTVVGLEAWGSDSDPARHRQPAVNVALIELADGDNIIYDYDLILCRSNKQEIGFIDASDVIYNPMFLEYNRISFTLYREIIAENGDVYENPMWEKVLPDMLVKVDKKINGVVLTEESEYFVIENPNKSYSEVDQLSFEAFSYEKIFLNNMNLSGFRDMPVQLYRPGEGHEVFWGDDLTLPRGIMNYILRQKWYNMWRIIHIDPEVQVMWRDGIGPREAQEMRNGRLGRYLPIERIVSFTGNNLRFAIDTLEESFQCVFVFDNVGMTISIFRRSLDMLGGNRGLVVSDDDYMLNINYSQETTGVITRLTVFGKDSGTLAMWNPTGRLFVDDFGFYMNTYYMSPGLIKALEDYDIKLKRYGGWWYDGRDLSVYNFTIDDLNPDGWINGEWTNIVNILDEASRFEHEDMENRAGHFDAVLAQQMPRIRQIRNDLAWHYVDDPTDPYRPPGFTGPNFTAEQLAELVPFIKEHTEPINTISDGFQLYQYALRHLEVVAFAPTSIDMEVLDILSIEEHQHDWLKLRVGDFVNLYRKEFDLEYREMRLIAYEHNPIQHTLRLQFSNKDELTTKQWLKNLFFFNLRNLEDDYRNERDWYLQIPTLPQIPLPPGWHFDFDSWFEEINNTLSNIGGGTGGGGFYAHWDHLKTNFRQMNASEYSANDRYVYYKNIVDTHMQYVKATVTLVDNLAGVNLSNAGSRLEQFGPNPAHGSSWALRSPQGMPVYWVHVDEHGRGGGNMTLVDPVSFAGSGSNDPWASPDATNQANEQLRFRHAVKCRRIEEEVVVAEQEYIHEVGGGGDDGPEAHTEKGIYLWNYFERPEPPAPDPDPDDPDPPDPDDDDDDDFDPEGVGGLRVTDYAYEWDDREKQWHRLGVVLRRRIPTADAANPDE